MIIDHLTFFLIITLPFLIIVWIDRGNAKTYLKLGIFAIVLDLIWDPIGLYFGLWYYNTWPQVLGISVYTLVLYLHYLTFCYFFGNKLNSLVVKWK